VKKNVTTPQKSERKSILFCVLRLSVKTFVLKVKEKVI